MNLPVIQPCLYPAMGGGLGNLNEKFSIFLFFEHLFELVVFGSVFLVRIPFAPKQGIGITV